ncbi:MAG: hypothetical protein A3E87_03360 [Gammaproteobacteria bacterium RIFCSPHIGHO2_12_FULL_35_23]|nr:MAG: hypothetical protein A3E87_03360 [Gammaproteobacteria bacterium RIFCSPHIGHO2_12_FULL_35_23]
MKKKSKFKPAWWLKNAHMQTIWPTLTRPKIKLKLQRQRFELSDGDFLDLDWIENTDPTAPIVVVLHGLGGSINSPYALGTLQAIQQANWRGVLMHFRGASEEHNRLACSYHAAETMDIKEFIYHLKEKEPNTPIGCVGYSLGGNVLLKWLGETGSKNPLAAAIAISVPFDLNKVLNRFNKGFSRFYSRYLLQQLTTNVINKFSATDSYIPLDLEKIKKATSFSDFDNNYTAPVHGFANAYDYYQRASSRHYLKEIRVPTLILHSEDDPFMTPDAVPDESELSDYVTLELSPQGGHVGFVAGRWPWQAEYWLERRIPEFLSSYLNINKSLASVKALEDNLNSE